MCLAIDRFIDCLFCLGRCCLVLESLYFWLRVDQKDSQCLLFVANDNAVLWNGMQVKRPSASKIEQAAANFCALGGGCWAYGVASILEINASRQAVPSSCLFVLLLPARIRVRSSRTRSKDKNSPNRLSKWSYCIILPDLLSLSNALFLHHQESFAHIDQLICKIRSSILVVTNKTDGRVN